MSDNSIDDALVGILNLPLVKKVMTTLRSAGGEARLVGGAVRDILAQQTHNKNINIDKLEIDMATNMHPQQAMAVLSAAGLKVLPTGIKHGTITIFDCKDKAFKIEVTSLRCDAKTDGRHAEVAFIEEWQEDAARRDFTINSIYLDQAGEIYDPFAGRADLITGQVRFIGNANERIIEDHLRILRFFRFHAQFCRSEADPQIIATIKEHRQLLKKISGERIHEELFKLLSLKPVRDARGDIIARKGIEALMAAEVDTIITKKGFDLPAWEALVMLCEEFSLTVSPLVALAALVHQNDVNAIMTRLRLSAQSAQTLIYLSSALPADIDDDCNWQQSAWAALPDKTLPKSVFASNQALAWRYAVQKVKNAQPINKTIFKRLAIWNIPTLPVKGQDLLNAGFSTGKELGVMLSYLEKEWAASNMKLDRAALIALIPHYKDQKLNG